MKVKNLCPLIQFKLISTVVFSHFYIAVNNIGELIESLIVKGTLIIKITMKNEISLSCLNIFLLFVRVLQNPTLKQNGF